MDKEAYESELKELNYKEYLKLVNVGTLADKEVEAKLKSAFIKLWSQGNRFNVNIQLLKYNFLFDKNNTVTACIKATYESTSCIIGYLYSVITKDSYKHEYLCFGPTYSSQDGEYRGRLQPWWFIKEVLDKYQEEFTVVDKLVVDKMNAKLLTFQVDFYYPPGVEQYSREYEESINSLRIPIRAFSLCWMSDFYAIESDFIPNHTNPAYIKIIHCDYDRVHMDEIIKMIGGEDEFIEMKKKIDEFWPNVADRAGRIVDVVCGQKIIPVSAMEATKQEDINFSVWREIYIARLTSNLVLNLITPCFSFINNWFFIRSAHAGLFDNIVMHRKYLYSDVAKEISTQMRSADSNNYRVIDGESLISYPKFSKLSKDMRKNIAYADSEISLTDLAICVTMEHVGRTMRDIPSLIGKRIYNQMYDDIFTDLNVFHRHMFEFIYSFYHMNEKIGIIHGDTHLNNVSIYSLYATNGDRNILTVKDPRVVYICDSVPYIFQHSGKFSMIIDFSRSIVGNPIMLAEEFGKIFAEKYLLEQNQRVITMVKQHLPGVYEQYRDKFDAMLMLNFPMMFKILSAIDTFVLMTNIRSMCLIDPAFKIVAPTLGVMEFLNSIVPRVRNIIVDLLEKVFTGEIKSSTEIPWPNRTLIEEYFQQYIFCNDKIEPDLNIVEIFNSSNKITYDIQQYDTWGPSLQIDTDIRLRKKYGLDPEDLSDWLKFKNADRQSQISEIGALYDADNNVSETYDWMFM